MGPRSSDLFLRSQSDERLIALAPAGHVRAFGVIVERYGRELLAHAHHLRSDGSAEDVVQQAFLGAFAAVRAGTDVRHVRDGQDGGDGQGDGNGHRANPACTPSALVAGTMLVGAELRISPAGPSGRRPSSPADRRAGGAGGSLASARLPLSR